MARKIVSSFNALSVIRLKKFHCDDDFHLYVVNKCHVVIITMELFTFEDISLVRKWSMTQLFFIRFHPSRLLKALRLKEFFQSMNSIVTSHHHDNNNNNNSLILNIIKM